MQRALNRTAELLDVDEASALALQLRRIRTMPRATRLFRRIASASGIDQLNDYLAELRYMLVFLALGFRVEIEPHGEKGPDLRVSRDGARAVVEVTRFRRVHPGPPALGKDPANASLKVYGNPDRDVRKSFEKILHKLPQLARDSAIVALWNDDGDLEEFEVRDAVKGLREDASTGLFAIPPSFLFVIYASPWVRAGEGKQIWCFPVTGTIPPEMGAWCRQLEASRISALVHAAVSQVEPAG